MAVVRRYVMAETMLLVHSLALALSLAFSLAARIARLPRCPSLLTDNDLRHRQHMSIIHTQRGTCNSKRSGIILHRAEIKACAGRLLNFGSDTTALAHDAADLCFLKADLHGHVGCESTVALEANLFFKICKESCLDERRSN